MICKDLVPFLPPNNIHVWYATLNEPIAMIGSFINLLSQEEKDRAKNFSFEKYSHRFIATHGILRLLLASYLKIPAQKINIKTEQFVKPFVLGSKKIEFNLSHSEELIAFAFSVKNPVGIDVEAIKDVEAYIEIAKRFFAHKEYEDLISLDEKDRKKAFFHCWARKEAFLKTGGLGISSFLNKFIVSTDISAHTWTPQNAANINDNAIEKRFEKPLSSYEGFTLDIDPHYAAALCVDGKEQKIEFVRKIDYSSLF